MTKTYVTTPSDNFAERERQVGDYHPELCFTLAQTHYAYGWAPNRRGDWDVEQTTAYLQGFAQASARAKDSKEKT